MMELTFNLTEDRREPLKPQSLKDFELTFGNGSGVNVQSNNWVQGRLQMDNLRQVFVNIQQGKANEPYDITGYILQFCGRTPFDGKQQSYRVIDNSSVVVDGLHGRFRYTFPAQAFAVAGTYKQAYFRLIRLSDYKCIATLEFDLSVLEDFVFADMVPSDYISPFNDILNQLLDGEKKFKADTQTLYEEAAKRLNDAADQLLKLGADVRSGLQEAQQGIDNLSAKIKDNHIFTEQEADAFKQSLSDQLTNSVNQKVDAAIAEIKSYGLATTNIRKQIVYNGYWSNLDLSHSGGVYTSTLDSIKNEIDQMAPLVDGVTLIFRQYITGGKLVVLENLDTFKQAIAYAKSKGLSIAGYKFHCETSIDDIKSYGVSEFFAAYKANVDKVTSALPEAGVPLILFNERGDLYGATSPYSGNVRNVLQDLVSATFKVNISFQSLQDFVSADPHVQEIVDSILINSYARISDKNRETTLTDISTGIDVNFYNMALYVHSLYPKKPLIMSEFGIKNNWAAFDETWNWNFSSVYDDPTGKVSYLYLRGLMQSETIKLFDGVWLWFYADLLQSDAGKEYLRAYKKGVI
ncbi:phage baseplate upper protein [Limosilactobacillus reuteri]|uniref:BppU family phage baseplate upper protein n=1 Tax=Limosilactobacillus reuteri TaxID=1598 RepID=UPI001E5371F7|nr:BppU family phage baseplate upper protein [Limosilactobacillus reuteri]MCC4352314.1 phage baseplate upper protein [Limosilactobacillus reuteri]MCC4377020.1 phage baseplate upper protein [Limosilactobacillus reuteri]